VSLVQKERGGKNSDFLEDERLNLKRIRNSRYFFSHLNKIWIEVGWNGPGKVYAKNQPREFSEGKY